MERLDIHDEIKLEWFRSHVQVTRDFGLFALKTIVALNSGAFVVLLTFLGSDTASSRYNVPLDDLKLAMALFLLGMSLSFTTIAYTYIVSTKVDPYSGGENRYDGWFVPIAVMITAGAFISFLSGVLTIIFGVEMASVPQ